jgi:hypothetical protein
MHPDFLTQASEPDLLAALAPFMRCRPMFSNTVSAVCLQRGLLPAHLLSCLDVLEFLSVTVLAAQKAQRTTGVRCSVLLSMALDEFSLDLNGLTRGQSPVCEDESMGKISPRIEQWFSSRSRKLACAPYKAALPCKNMETYVYWICDLGFGNSQKAADLWANIKTYHLQDCDRAGMLPLGEYSFAGYDPISDAAGNLAGVAPNNFRKIVRCIESSSQVA